MENFVVSARKYRPLTFQSVIGQDHITSTLRNAIQRNQLAHAYLFTGPRGVGKTTCARIFAKAINCLSPTADAEACGVCESCRGFAEGRSFNIHELDAASNNSVEDIRNLTDQVRIPPQIGKYSLYIIDEVHMLSSAAFNAFLKTLEEPPRHAIFILATTEKHKILPTILSRCQIYDFNRIRVEDTVKYLQYIAGKEAVTYDDESLHIIAQKSDGGMRDALSMFDRVVSFCGSHLEVSQVSGCLNVLDFDTYFKATELAFAEKYTDLLILFDDVLRRGFDGQMFLSGLSSHFRDLLVAKDPATLPLLEVTGSVAERYRKQATSLETPQIFDAINLISAADATYRQSVNRRLHVELALLKLCGFKKKNSDGEYTLPKFVATESAPAVVASTPSATSAPVASAPVSQQPQPQPQPQPQSSVSPTITTPIQPSEPIPVPASTPPATVQPAPQPISQPTPTINVSGFSLRDIGAKDTSAEGGVAADTHAERVVTQSAEEIEQRINASYDRLLEHWRELRPRIAIGMQNHSVRGSELTVRVPNEVMQCEMYQCKQDIEISVMTVADVQSVSLVVEVTDDVAEVKVPISVEDRVKFLIEKNPGLLKLKDELDLVV